MYLPLNKGSAILDLNNASLIEFYKAKKGKSYEVMVDGAPVVSQVKNNPGDIDRIKEFVKVYNEQMYGNYYWLYPNVVINLDHVSAVTCDKAENKLSVTYGGKTSVYETDVNLAYTNYLQHIDSIVDATQEETKEEKPKEKETITRDFNKAANTTDVTLGEMIGIEGPLKKIEQHLDHMIFQEAKKQANMNYTSVSRHLLILGNPGTGKTTVVRLLPEKYYEAGIIREKKLVEISAKDIIAGFIGQTTIKTQAKIDEARGGILYIDEAHDFGMSKDSKGDFNADVFKALVPALENDRNDLIVIMAGYHDETLAIFDMNRGLFSRLPTIIQFEDYDIPTLGKIMSQMLPKYGLSITDEALEKSLEILKIRKDTAPKGHFGNAREVRNLVEQLDLIVGARLKKEGKLPGKLTSEMTVVQLKDLEAVDLSTPNKKGHRSPIGYKYAQRNN